MSTRKYSNSMNRIPGLAQALAPSPAIDNIYDFYNGSNDLPISPAVDNMYDFYNGSNDLPVGNAAVPIVDNMYDFYDGSNNLSSNNVPIPSIDDIYDFYNGSNDLPTSIKNATSKKSTKTKRRAPAKKTLSRNRGVPGTYNFDRQGNRMPDDWAGPNEGSINPFSKNFDPSLLFGGRDKTNTAQQQINGSSGGAQYTIDEILDLF